MILKERDRLVLKHTEQYGYITIKQCSRIFYINHSLAYDEARKRLKKLCDNQYLRKYINSSSNEIIYCSEIKKFSQHDIYLMDFYSMLINFGCNIISFEKEKKWLDGKIRSDAYVEVELNGSYMFFIIEIDLTHLTKIDKYIPLYESRELQLKYRKEYGANIDLFPKLCIVNGNPNKTYNGDFDVMFMEYNLSHFTRILT